LTHPLDSSLVVVLGGALVVALFACCMLIYRQQRLTRALTGLSSEGDVAKGAAGLRELIDQVTERREQVKLRERALHQAEKSLVMRAVAHSHEVEGARSAAEAPNRARGELLAGISHELRTPLGAVLGFGDLLLTTELTTEQQHFTTSIQSAGQALRMLIDDLLGFSQGETEGAETVKLDLRQLITSVMESPPVRTEAKDLKLSYTVAGSVPTRIRQDRGRLRQVLSHLASNAVKFTPRGNVSIKVANARSSDTPRLRFTVQDTGIGIPDKALSSVFDPFSQVDSSDKRRFGGMGMGLAISKRIVEELGGTLEVTSTLGVGSSFWFEIPFENVAPKSKQVEVFAGSLKDRVPRLKASRSERDRRVHPGATGMPLPVQPMLSA